MRRALLLLAALAAGCTIDHGPRITPAPPTFEPPDSGNPACDFQAAKAAAYEESRQLAACVTRDQCVSVEPAPGTCWEGCKVLVRDSEVSNYQRDVVDRFTQVCACVSFREFDDCAASEAACLDGVCTQVLLGRPCGGDLDGGVSGRFTRCGLDPGIQFPSQAQILTLLPIDPSGGNLMWVGQATFLMPRRDGGLTGTFTLGDMSEAHASATRTDGVRFELAQGDGGTLGDATLSLNDDLSGVLRATLVARYPDGGAEETALGVKLGSLGQP